VTSSIKKVVLMLTLRKYSKTDFLTEGDPDLLKKLYPAFERLIDSLEKLGTNATVEQRRAAFAEAFAYINRYEDEIETVEREAILEAIYEIGEIVGFDRETEFAEEWRGDW
jgi:hypothetical protein